MRCMYNNNLDIKIAGSSCPPQYCRLKIERLKFTFTQNGKHEFVPHDQVFPNIVIKCLLFQLLFIYLLQFNGK